MSTSVHAVYHDPSSGQLFCLSGGSATPVANSNPNCETLTAVDVHTFPDFQQGSADGDFAVLVAKATFQNVSSSDFASLDIDELGGVARVEVYGYGFAGFSGEGAGILRRGAGELESFERHHFNVTGGGARVCKGDSGGPASIYFSETDPVFDVIGVLSEYQRNSNPNCADDGGSERYSRVSPKMSWVEEQIGIPCRESSMIGRRVKECW